MAHVFRHELVSSGINWFIPSVSSAFFVRTVKNVKMWFFDLIGFLSKRVSREKVIIYM
jgi:hypothetical protein